jgi:hypothetical protein
MPDARHRLHLLTGAHFDEHRFTGAIAIQLPPSIDIVRITHTTMCGPWTFQGVECNGLRDDFWVLENTETGAFKVIDFQDSAQMLEPLVKLPTFRGAAVMMFHPPSIRQHYGDLAHLITPGWFTDQTPHLTQSYRPQVAQIREQPLDPRLFFRGTIHGENGADYTRDGLNIREVATVLRDKYPQEVDISGTKISRLDWFLEAAQHTVVLTLPGHPWCYREFELMSLGIPLLTYRWTSFLYHQPLHYIPVEGLALHRIGFALDPEKAADAIIERYRLVRDRPVFLSAVARQAQEWYDTFWTPTAIARDMLRFFDLPSLL